MTDLATTTPSAANFLDEWERQPGEPLKAFKAFTIFRDMGDDRAVHKVREAGVRATANVLLGWANQHRWVERANAFDRYLDRRRVAAHVAEVEAMARREVQAGQVLQHTGLSWVKEQLSTEEQRAKNLSATSALRFVEKGIDLEREGLGMDRDETPADAASSASVLDSQTKADIFDRIDQMATNMQQVESMIRSRAITAPANDPGEDIVDGELVEGEELDSDEST